MKERSNEQKLVDICFDIAITVWCNRRKFKNNEDVAECVANNLRAFGFPTVPCGMSWGVLKEGGK